MRKLIRIFGIKDNSSLSITRSRSLYSVQGDPLPVDEVLCGRVGCHVCGPFGPNVLVGLHHDPSRGMSQASSPGDILGLESGDVSGVRGVAEEGDSRFLCKARVPPKIQLFAWKVCQEAIPGAINLKKRGVQVEAACGRCSSGEEDTLHVLLSCEFGRQVWALSDLPVHTISQSGYSTKAWLVAVSRSVCGGQFSL
ncbi:hypothetical protein Sango_0797200 [Sesamum angolense]|uniref:Reverse transcriptase zinc-binding domain-containing protein n=1 Tax=Sesamum angolense TaxID=2727404 RepID=A0AAE2C098_9LAMI|nr:hypothetical protein Sango_0797200 [Sesamum angolense]